MTIDANLIEGFKIGFGIGFLLALVFGFCLGGVWIHALMAKDRREKVKMPVRPQGPGGSVTS